MAVLLFFTNGEEKPVSSLAWRGIDVLPLLPWCHLPPKRRRILLPRTSWHLTNQILLPVCCWGKSLLLEGGSVSLSPYAPVHLSLSITLSISTRLAVYLFLNSCPTPQEALTSRVILSIAPFLVFVQKKSGKKISTIKRQIVIDSLMQIHLEFVFLG